ncbi:MAG: histidine kinase [Gammaproteobacteria bacterium]
MAKRLFLKLGILLLNSAVLVFGMVLGGGIILHNARKAVEAEMRSSTELAKRLVIMLLDQADATLSQTLTREMQGALHKQRHVRVILEPTENDRDRIADIQEQLPDVPAWFVRLTYPKQPIRHQVRIRDSSDGGHIVIEADPADEIQEVWEDVRKLWALGVGVFFLVGVLLHLMLWFGLRPLDNLLLAFERLEQEDFGIRLKEDGVLEIVRINRKFNQLAKVLHRSRADNRLLTTKLVNLQEEERRQIARELHDEMAPLLFNVQVHASAAAQMLGDARKEITTCLQSINDTASKLQERVRMLLRHLRPIELDGFSFEDALKDLIESWRRKGLSIEWKFERSDNTDGLTEPIKITVYRILQECLTNIARHANAQSVSAYVGLSVRTDSDPTSLQAKDQPSREPMLRVCVEDDGKGIQAGTQLGLGLIGMRERVQVFGGSLELINNKNKQGLHVQATIPLGHFDSFGVPAFTGT